MGYEGELVRTCEGTPFVWDKTYAVVVSGEMHSIFGFRYGNVWGHMLLNTGGSGGQYFQVADSIHGLPRSLNEAQFQRYLKENDKIIVSVVRVKIANPREAQTKLEEIMSQKFWWGGVTHNCVTLVQEVIDAGGGPKLYTGAISLPMNLINSCTQW